MRRVTQLEVANIDLARLQGSAYSSQLARLIGQGHLHAHDRRSQLFASPARLAQRFDQLLLVAGFDRCRPGVESLAIRGDHFSHGNRVADQ